MKLTRRQLRSLILQEARILRFPSKDSPTQIELDQISARDVASRRSDNVDMVPQEMDPDYDFAFLDDRSGELHHRDDLYGTGGGFGGHMPDMYYVYAGLKKMGYKTVDGKSIDHLLFYASNEK